jgi:hypothetical protein
MGYNASPFGRDRRRKGNSRRAHRHRPDRRYAARRLRLESLEDRRLLAVITWDGEAGTTDWHDEANWSTNTVPGPSDDVQLDAVAVHISEDLAVQSLALHGGSLNVAANATVAQFEFKGGTLAGSGTVTVNEIVVVRQSPARRTRQLRESGILLVVEVRAPMTAPRPPQGGGGGEVTEPVPEREVCSCSRVSREIR